MVAAPGDRSVIWLLEPGCAFLVSFFNPKRKSVWQASLLVSSALRKRAWAWVGFYYLWALGTFDLCYVYATSIM